MPRPQPKAVSGFAFALLFTLAPPLAGAPAGCECLWQGAFIQVAHKADLVVSGRVVQRKGNSFDVDLDEVLKGREFRPAIRVWAHPGEGRGTPGAPLQPSDGDLHRDRQLSQAQWCRAAVETFDPGSEWVLALQRIDVVPAGGFNPATPNISFGRLQDYAISGCGVYWLQRDAEVVSGNIVDARRWEYRGEPKQVLLYELLTSYLRGERDRSILEEAVSNPDRRKARQLMDQTLDSLRQ